MLFRSGLGFAPEGAKIRYGLAALKGVGEKAVEALAAARRAGGAFVNLYDFCERVDSRACNRAVLEALIKAGAFAFLGARRAQLAAALDAAMAAGAGVHRDRAAGQLSLLGEGGMEPAGAGGPPALPEVPEWPENKLLEFEKAVLGFYLSSHPLARHERMIRGYSTAGTDRLAELADGAEVTVGGLIAGIKYTATKKDGRRMARVFLEDLSGTVEAVAFPRTFEACAEHLAVDNIVFLRGRLDRKLDRPAIIIDEVIPLAEARGRLSGAAVLRLNAAEVTDEFLAELEKLLAEHRGTKPVYFLVATPEGATVRVRAGNGGVKPSEALYQDLAVLVGEGHVDFPPEGR